MDELTKKETAILEFLRAQIDETGIVPSMREICTRLHIKSTSTVHRCLSSLEWKGYLTRENNLNRAIRLCGPSFSRVPVIGTVTAGQPILATQSIESYIPVVGNTDGLFALHVRGDSMVNAGIFDGDLLLVRQCASAKNGDIVVALLGDEATVKRFYKENGRFRLQPENDSMQPIWCDDVAILGKVEELRRSF